MKKKKILIVVSQGIVCRNFLQTNFLKSVFIPSEYELSFVTSEALLDKFDKYETYILVRVPVIIEYLHKMLRQRFYQIRPNKSLEILKNFPLYPSLKLKFRWILSFPFPRNVSIYNYLLKLYDYYFRNFLRIQKKLTPDVSQLDLIVITNPISIKEAAYILIGKMYKIPTIGLVKSFDNLTTKGFMPYLPDELCVWNEKMFFEAINIYDYSAKKVHVVGAPHFNTKKNINLSKKSHFNDKILFASVSPEINPYDVEIVKRIRRDVSKKFSILVRIHQNDSIDRWRKMINELNVKIFNPSQKTRSFERVSDKNTLYSLKKQIEDSFVIINTASTMSLEAISLKRPVINIAFSLNNKTNILNYYFLDHYRYLERSKNIYFCFSYEELIETINKVKKVGWIEDEYFNKLILGPVNTAENFKNVVKKTLRKIKLF